MSGEDNVKTGSPQEDALARRIAAIADVIMDYYKDPAHEAAFQAWYLQRYGHPAPEGV